MLVYEVFHIGSILHDHAVQCCSFHDLALGQELSSEEYTAPESRPSQKDSSLPIRCYVSFREGKGVKPNDFCRITCYLSLATNVIRSATWSMEYGYDFCKAREFLKQSSFRSVTLGVFKHPKMGWDKTRPLHGMTHLVFFCWPFKSGCGIPNDGKFVGPKYTAHKSRAVLLAFLWNNEPWRIPESPTWLGTIVGYIYCHHTSIVIKNRLCIKIAKSLLWGIVSPWANKSMYAMYLGLRPNVKPVLATHNFVLAIGCPSHFGCWKYGTSGQICMTWVYHCAYIDKWVHTFHDWDVLLRVSCTIGGYYIEVTNSSQILELSENCPSLDRHVCFVVWKGFMFQGLVTHCLSAVKRTILFQSTNSACHVFVLTVDLWVVIWWACCSCILYNLK